MTEAEVLTTENDNELDCKLANSTSDKHSTARSAFREMTDNDHVAAVFRTTGRCWCDAKVQTGKC